MDTKSKIRKEVLEKRNHLTSTEKEKASLMITERILGHQWYYRADIILGFFPYGSEIDIREILRDALNNGKKLYLPKVTDVREQNEMKFFRVYDLKDLQEGYHNIPEPDGNTECFSYREEEVEKVLMIMPGVAFDSYRNRIGYGKGFYDNFLKDKEKLRFHTIAVGFRCQMVPELPAEDWDCKPYQVICV